MPTVINLDIGPQFLFGHTKPFLSVHDNVIIYDNIVMRFGYLSKSLGFFSGGLSPSLGSPRSGMYLLSVYSVFKVHEGIRFVPQ